jgi:hypothetical protein
VAGGVDGLHAFSGGHLPELDLGERVAFACQAARGRADEYGDPEDGGTDQGGTGQGPASPVRDALVGRRDSGPGDSHQQGDEPQ